VRRLTILTLFFLAAAHGAYCRSFEFRYVLELDRGGDAMPVSPLSGFETGDRLKVRLQASQDSYCYLAVGRPDGYFELAPGPVLATADWIELPDDAWLRFDRWPGVEMLYLIVTSQPVPEVERLQAACRFSESALLKIRALYQTGVTSERVAAGELVRMRHKAGDCRPFVVLEPIRLRHR
jgi:hypothetical protein